MYYRFKPYVSVAERRRKAQATLARYAKTGKATAPIRLAGRTIAGTFWGRAWCDNLERYSDYANRLPRGRSYLRNGAVIDLKIACGEVAAQVMGSSLYTVKIKIAPVARPHWKALCKDCAGGIDSLVELLQGRFSKGVMERICRQGEGLFPSPKEIDLDCSCPDWADMCKHVAAVLYGVGARLDTQPQLLFELRQVDSRELIAAAGKALPRMAPASARVLDEAGLGEMFGIEMAAHEPKTGRPRTTPKSATKAAGAKPTHPQTPKRPAKTAAAKKVAMVKKTPAKRTTAAAKTAAAKRKRAARAA